MRKRIGRVGAWLGIPGWKPASLAREAIVELEELGYRTVWIAEGHNGKESFSRAGLLLASSRCLVVATGIANIWVRDPTAMVAASLTLAEAYPGRFLLGMGVSHPPQVEPRGHVYAKPVSAMRAYLDAMDSVDYAGPRPQEPVVRVLAALRPPMLKVARERAQGAHPYLVPPEHTRRGRELLGPDRLLAPEQAVVLERDPARARAIARAHMAWYLTLPNYTENLRWHGFDDSDFVGGGSDRLVDAIAARVVEHLDAGADHVALQPLSADGDVGVDQLRELAPTVLAL